uniref:AlNc14C51G4027 protein n=1 Tax=Albugo laibachii Nc14 TaxID=890382 RepID=F0WBI1_9STRA|nr:AlNc14C51G4027 [Albugo laibachii Nc14]|eukprot:CCA18508.1 AlNc14C51G4027 [Albugo laibachii Nc14]
MGRVFIQRLATIASLLLNLSSAANEKTPDHITHSVSANWDRLGQGESLSNREAKQILEHKFGMECLNDEQISELLQHLKHIAKWFCSEWPFEVYLKAFVNLLNEVDIMIGFAAQKLKLDRLISDIPPNLPDIKKTLETIPGLCENFGVASDKHIQDAMPAIKVKAKEYLEENKSDMLADHEDISLIKEILRISKVPLGEQILLWRGYIFGNLFPEIKVKAITEFFRLSHESDPYGMDFAKEYLLILEEINTYHEDPKREICEVHHPGIESSHDDHSKASGSLKDHEKKLSGASQRKIAIHEAGGASGSSSHLNGDKKEVTTTGSAKSEEQPKSNVNLASKSDHESDPSTEATSTVQKGSALNDRSLKGANLK